MEILKTKKLKTPSQLVYLHIFGVVFALVHGSGFLFGGIASLIQNKDLLKAAPFICIGVIEYLYIIYALFTIIKTWQTIKAIKDADTRVGVPVTIKSISEGTIRVNGKLTYTYTFFANNVRLQMKSSVTYVPVNLPGLINFAKSKPLITAYKGGDYYITHDRLNEWFSDVLHDYLSTHPENRELYDQMYRAELDIQINYEREAARRRR